MSYERTAVITGASRGIGLALAREFHARSFRVFGVARTPIAEDAVDTWIGADITTEEGQGQILAAIGGADARLDVLVNNAGRGIQETWAAMSEEDLRAVMELNFFAPVALTRRLLPNLGASEGTVINVSSVAGKVGLACMGGYCASKFALSAFSESLRAEVQPDGIGVLNLVVGRIGTDFGRHVLGTKSAPATRGVASADRLARIAFRAYRRDRGEIIFPAWYRPAICFAKLFPKTFARKCRQAWGLPKS